ncbi:NUDIX hydrolase [Streptomyces sp. NPDC001508]|uniref:NUDIX hydrolase n=1 Tax=Streptomyces sp. NPDC001508 TaxID=3154656 RepID=UPI003328D082
MPLIARVLLTDERRRILIVHATGRRPRWGLPGGIIGPCEPPRTAAEREIREELGLDITAGALLAQEWVPPHTPGRRARMTLYFTGPQLSETETARISLQPEEADDHAWAWATQPARHGLQPRRLEVRPRSFLGGRP